MSNNEIIEELNRTFIDLGSVTAYAIAVKYGYTGTEEEWASQFENIGEYVQEAKQKIIAQGNATSTAIDEKTQRSLSLLPGDVQEVGEDIATLKEALANLYSLLRQVRDALDNGDIDEAINLLDTFLLGEGVLE